MNVKAEAFQEYNQAAVIDRLFASMPEIVKALAAPLANVDKITIVSTGNGDAAGMNKITGDITKMAAQVPALFETLSGMPLSELLGKVRQIGDKFPFWKRMFPKSLVVQAFGEAIMLVWGPRLFT